MPPQVVTLCSLGLDLPRGVVYGACSLLAPVGYGRCRDPDEQPLGISLLPGYSERYGGGGGGQCSVPGEGDRSPEQVRRRRGRNFWVCGTACVALERWSLFGGGVKCEFAYT